MTRIGRIYYIKSAHIRSIRFIRVQNHEDFESMKAAEETL